MLNMTTQHTYVDQANIHYELFTGEGRGTIVLKDLDAGKLILVRGGNEEMIRKIWNQNMDTLLALDMAAKLEVAL